MPHNPSRYSERRLDLEEQLQVDGYRARAVWGRWWQLAPELRARYFNQDELRWIRRYGARLDELANGGRPPRNDRERHFVAVMLAGAMPQTDRERLWLRVAMVCRFDECVTKAALCDRAMETAAGLDAEARQLRRDMDDAEEVVAELVDELGWRRGDVDQLRRRSIRNVEWATPRFDLDPMGPRLPLRMVPPAPMGPPTQVLSTLPMHPHRQ